MTDIRFTGFVRGLPLVLEPDVFDLIVGDRDDLRWGGKPNLSRIARIAGVNHQRLARAAKALENGDGSTGPYPHVNTMGAVVRAYAVIHGVDDKTACSVVLRVVDPADTAMERAA